jgi:hypothetical protein
MRNVVLVAFVAWIATTSWAQSQESAKSETLVRWSFAGTQALGANAELKTFNSIRALPEAVAMREAMATNLAHSAAARFLSRENNNSSANAARAKDQIALLIQPLITDLVQHESRFQMDTQGAQDADWFLGVKLPADRAEKWGSALTQLASLSGMKGAEAGKQSWVANRDNYKVSFSRSKDWTVVQGGYGDSTSKTAKNFRDSLEKRRGKSVLEAEVNGPLLGKIWSDPKLSHAPKLTLKAEPRKDSFQSELLLDYPQDLGIKPEKWNVPAEIIHDPLIGFTAIQGIAKKLASLDKFKALGAKQTPNQAFLWSQGISPFSVALAAEVKNTGEVITNAARVAKQFQVPTGNISLATNRTALLWLGLPIAVPYLQPAPEPRQSFVTAGLFPVALSKPKPAPKELFEQLNDKNLIYYDWEITSERIQQWLPIWQLYYLVAGKFAPDNSAPSAKFIQKLKTQLGNTVTVGTLEKSNQIKFVRSSALGATALELVLLSHYFDAGDLRSVSPGARHNIPALPQP